MLARVRPGHTGNGPTGSGVASAMQTGSQCRLSRTTVEHQVALERKCNADVGDT